MVQVPWQDILNPSINDPITNLARSARSAMCRLRQISDNLFYGRGPAATQGLMDVLTGRAVWDRICFDLPAPTTSVQQGAFFGGQCATTYNIVGYFLPAGSTAEASQLLQVVGPLRQVYISYSTPNTSQRIVRINAMGANGILATNNIFTGSFAQVDGGSARFTIARLDGQPDNCGNPIPIIIQPPAPPPTIYNIPVTINNQSTNLFVELPELVVNNWPDFEFNPVVRIEGIDFAFNLGGIDINLPQDFTLPPVPGVDVDLDPVLNRITEAEISINTSVSEAESSILNQLSILGEDIDDLGSLIRCCCCEDGVTLDAQVLSTESSGGRFPLPANTVAVRIQGSNIDTNFIRTQDGSGSAPSVFFWGWHAVCYGNAEGGLREPLSYLDTSIFVDERATSVIVNPTYGATCTVTAIVKNKNCEGS